MLKNLRKVIPSLYLNSHAMHFSDPIRIEDFLLIFIDDFISFASSFHFNKAERNHHRGPFIIRCKCKCKYKCKEEKNKTNNANIHVSAYNSTAHLFLLLLINKFIGGFVCILEIECYRLRCVRVQTGWLASDEFSHISHV